MSFANYDLEAQKPASTSGGGSELDKIFSSTSTQIQTFGSLISQFNSQRRLVGSKRDSANLREKLDLLQTKIAGLDAAIAGLTVNINKAIDQSLEITERQTMQKERISQDYASLHKSFKEALDQYNSRKVAIPLKSLDTEDTPLLQKQPEQQTQEQQQLTQEQIDQTELQYHLLLTEERNREIDRVAASVQEVNSVFKDLSTLVNQQGEQLDTIEENVQELHGNTQQASRELHKAHEYQKRKGKWSCILLIVLLVIVLVIVLAVVS